MNTVLFAHPKEKLPEKTLLPGKIELFDMLRQRDMRPVLTFEGESAFNPVSVEVHDLLAEDTTRAAGSVALHETGVIVNRLDRSVRRDDMPDTWNESGIPVVNENELRSLVFRKHRVQAEVLEPLGVGMASSLVDSPKAAVLFAHENPSDFYIAKPTSGTFSKGVDKIPADGLMDYFANPEKCGKTLLQPAYDFTLALPLSVSAYDTASKEAFEYWSRSNATKELRMYGFLAGESVDLFPVARAIVKGEDNWFFLDPESLPENIYETTRQVLERSARLTGSKAIYAALDMGYGKLGNDDPDYHVIELNGRMPYLVGYDKHPEVAKTLRNKFADQLQEASITHEGVQ